MVSGQWSAVSGQRSVVSGQRSAVSGQWSALGTIEPILMIKIMIKIRYSKRRHSQQET
ncbi:MAG: hypothetical protein ACRD1R_18390, partial [Acidobacteriota bacterium]